MCMMSLLDFQKKTIDKLINNYFECERIILGEYHYIPNIKILSNMIGSGKTIITLKFLEKLKDLKNEFITIQSRIWVSYKEYDDKELAQIFINDPYNYNSNVYTRKFNTIGNNLSIISSKMHSLKNHNTIVPTLIIVPKTIIHQWIREIKKTNLNYHIVDRPLHIPKKMISSPDVILIRHDLLKSWCNAHIMNLYSVVFHQIIIDEYDQLNLKNNITFYRDFPFYNCLNILLISTSISEIISSINNEYIHDIFLNYRNFIHFINKKYPLSQFHHKLEDISNLNMEWIIDSLQIKIPDNEILREIVLLGTVDHPPISCKKHILIDLIEKIFNEKMGKYLSDNDIGSLIQELNATSETNLYSIIYNKLKKEKDNIEYKRNATIDKKNGIQKTLQDLEEDNKKIPDIPFKNIYITIKKEILEGIVETDTKKIKTHEYKIREYTRQLDRISDKILSVNSIIHDTVINNVCYACSNSIVNPVFLKCCFYIVCKECIVNSQFCPNCKSKKPILFHELEIVIDNYKNTISDNSMSVKSKSDTMIDIINRLPINSKILLGIGNVSSFKIIEAHLEHENYHYFQLKGNIFSIRKKIKDFELSNSKMICLLDTNYNATGLNLQFVSDIVLFTDELNNEIINQIVGRVMRLGQKNPVNVYTLTDKK